MPQTPAMPQVPTYTPPATQAPGTGAGVPAYVPAPKTTGAGAMTAPQLGDYKPIGGSSYVPPGEYRPTTQK